MADTNGLLEALRCVEEAAAKGLWDQSTWMKPTACGTAGCLAGHYVMSQGYLPLTEHQEKYGIVQKDGLTYYDIEALATELLELDLDDAYDLFAPENSLEDLHRIVMDLVVRYSEIESPVVEEPALV